MHRFGCSYKEAREMTLKEYHLREQAWRLNEIHKKEAAIEKAFIDRIVSATNKKGKFIIRKPDEIFNVEEERNRVLGLSREIKNKDTLLQITRNLREYRSKKGHKNGK